MPSEHDFTVSVEWTGNRGSGTSGPRAFGRDAELSAPGREPIAASAARAFHGDADRWNPEELLMAALSECHLLSYLYAATRAGVVVEAYTDAATGVLEVDDDGAGRFREVTLHPLVTISTGDPGVASALHEEAARLCFIRNSVAFPVHHEPELRLVARG